MNRCSWWNLVLALGLMLSLAAGVTLAQELDPSTEESGSLAEGDDVPLPHVGEPDKTELSWAYSGGPDYDSGWIRVGQDQSKMLNHGLGGNVADYVVDMTYRSAGSGVNQRYYGGTDFGAKAFGGARENQRVGAYWRSLSDATITVYRRPEDIYAEQVRIRIWIDPYPDWDSGWVSPGVGGPALTLNHGLGGSVEDYVVGVQYRSGRSGVNQRYYGGADFGSKAFGGTREDERVGAYWRTLTDASITLFRRAEDNYATEVRVRIWIRPTPTYDSGWVAVSQDETISLLHRIGGDADDYVVHMQYRSGGSGVNQRYYGGADFGADPPGWMNENDRVGAYWRSLNSSTIAVYRRPEDTYAPEVRIRIWCFWKPPVPDYDSGWISIAQGVARTLSHGIGASAADYLVDLQYRSGGSGVNRRYHGGADFGSKAFGGTAEDDRVGAYWRSLTSSGITVYRRPEDSYAPEIRVRIWVMPKPDYDSGWVSLEAGAAAYTLNHDLQGNMLDYLVDMRYRSPTSGVNRRYYGGADFGANAPSGTSAGDRVGAYWRSLDHDTITVYRRPDDIYAPEVNIRIWRMAKPGWDSGWQVVGQDTAEGLSHNLGGDAANYVVNMIYYDFTDNYINQRHLGGADFGANPPSGYNTDDRVGAYWRDLDASGVVVYRRPEDGFADYVRIRIWVTPCRVLLPIVLRSY